MTERLDGTVVDQRAPVAVDEEVPMPPSLRAGVDLRTLLAEMAALRTEVRKETMAHREQRERNDALAAESKAALSALDRAVAELERRRESESSKAIDCLIDMADRLDASLIAARAGTAGFWSRILRRDRSAKALIEGLSITAGRVAELLATAGVERISSLDRAFDPSSMRAVDTGNDPSLPDGVVLTELIGGYRSRMRILRFCAVVVNRRTDRHGEERT